MNRKLSFLLMVSLGSTLVAQGQMTTPPVGVDKEGSYDCIGFGWNPAMTHQIVDDSHANGKSVAIKRISFRPDYRNQNAIGRTWSKVTVELAHADWSSLDVFPRTENGDVKLMDQPVVVFDKEWSFPAMQGLPPLRPAPWGGPKNSVGFTFSKPWVYNGKDAIFLRFKFSGGKADNNQPWKANQSGFEYFLDSMPHADWRITDLYGAGYGKGKGKNGSKTCYDSSFVSAKAPGYLKAWLRTPGGRVKFGMQTSYTAPKGPVLIALGTKGSAKGFDLATGCTGLFVDPTGPFAGVVLAAPNNAKGIQSASWDFPWKVWMTDLWVQAGWADSKTSRLRLTESYRFSINTPQRARIMATVTDPGGGKKDGEVLFPWSFAPKYIPYIRYEY